MLDTAQAIGILFHIFFFGEENEMLPTERITLILEKMGLNIQEEKDILELASISIYTDKIDEKEIQSNTTLSEEEFRKTWRRLEEFVNLFFTKKRIDRGIDICTFLEALKIIAWN